MEEIIRFVTLAQTDRFTLTDLRKQFSISRKTGCKHPVQQAPGPEPVEGLRVSSSSP